MVRVGTGQRYVLLVWGCWKLGVGVHFVYLLSPEICLLELFRAAYYSAAAVRFLVIDFANTARMFGKLALYRI